MLQPGHILSMHRAKRARGQLGAPWGSGRPAQRPRLPGTDGRAATWLVARGLLGGASLQRPCAWWARLGLPGRGGQKGAPRARARQLRGHTVVHAVTLQGVAPADGGRTRDVAGKNPPPLVSWMSNGPAPPQEPAQEPAQEPCGAEKGKPNTNAEVSVWEAARAAGRRARWTGRRAGRQAGGWRSLLAQLQAVAVVADLEEEALGQREGHAGHHVAVT